MTAHEFTTYFEERIEYLERMEDSANYRAGLISSMIANKNKGKRGKAAKPSDFFKFKKNKRNKKPMTANQMASHLKAITYALGGEVK
jgi:hypothetical protein